MDVHYQTTALSLSARRAWIEILGVSECAASGYVALRKESVDRNLVVALLAVGRAGVALRKESVDRNENMVLWYVNWACRSPQGERG